jgi:hypothetical protein
MRIVFLFVFFSFLFVSFHLEAQRKCATTLYEDRLHQHDREEYRLRFEKWMSDQLEKQKNTNAKFRIGIANTGDSHNPGSRSYSS